jgi:hypothetical protein
MDRPFLFMLQNSQLKPPILPFPDLISPLADLLIIFL